LSEAFMSDLPQRVLDAIAGQHGEIRDALVRLEHTLDAMANARRPTAAQVAVLEDVVRFLRGPLLAHFRAEDETLLPPLERAIGRFGTLVNVVDYDHQEVRRAVEKLAEGLRALQATQDRLSRREVEEVNRHGLFIVQYLGLHMVKEEDALAELLRAHLDADDWRAAAEAFGLPGG
jgi:hemerythrin-like domain-containing protein